MSKKTRTLTNKAGKLMKCDGQMLKKVIEAKGYKLYELSKMLRYCSDYLTTCCRKNQISDVAAKYLMDYKIFPQMYDLEGEIKVDEPKEVEIDKDEKKIEFGTPYGIVRSEKDLRKYIRQALTKGPHWGTDLMIIRDILDKARANGLSYNVENMRGDMLFYACKVNGDSEKWMHFVNHLNLKYDPTDREIKVDEPKEVKIDKDEASDEAKLDKLKKRMDFINRNAIYGIPKETAQETRDRINEAKEILNMRYGRPEKGVEGIDYGYGPALKNTSYCSYYAAGHDIAKGVFKLMQAAMNDLKHDREFKEMIKQAVKEAYEEL